MQNDNPSPNNTPDKIDKKWILAGILFMGTLLYVIAVLWIGIGSIQHVREINAAAQEANQASTEGQPASEDSETKDPKSPEPYPISDFITQALLVIGGALATHLGAYLGISITNTTRSLLTTKQEWIAFAKTAEGISGILAITYFLTLVTAIIFWAITGFSVYAGKPLQDLAYSFLGVFAGAMAALSKGD